MDFNEACVLIVLAFCSFIANVLQGLTGCGSILVLHVLWQLAITIAPSTLHNTSVFGEEDVKGIALFSYVLTFFIQSVLSALLFYQEHRIAKVQKLNGVSTTPSQLNGTLLVAFAVSSLTGAFVGLKTMHNIYENGLRIVLGASSLFFALTFLSLYRIKHTERKKIEDVIKEDLILMRVDRTVQSYVAQEALEARRKKQERRRRRRQARRAKKQNGKRQICTSASPAHPLAPNVSNRSKELTILSPSSSSSSSHPASTTATGSAAVAENATMKACVSPKKPASNASKRQLDVYHVELPSVVPGVHTTSSDVHLLDRHLSSFQRRHRLHHRRCPHHYDMDMNYYVRCRLGELRDQVSDESTAAERREGQLAASTLRAMVVQNVPQGDMANEKRVYSTTTTSSSSDDGNDDGSANDTEQVPIGVGMNHALATSFAKLPTSPLTCLIRRKSATAVDVAVTGSFTSVNGAVTPSLQRLNLSTAVQLPQLAVTVHSEEVNIGLREVQQQQLAALHHRSRKRLVHFIRMDGGVVVAAAFSAFFSGLLGSFTGVSDTPMSIFALAMDINSSVFRMNYAASSILPATLRLLVGISDDFVELELWPYYTVSILFGWLGVAAGLYVGHGNAISDMAFMTSVLPTMLLISFLMLVPIADRFIRVAATLVVMAVVAAVIYREQRPPDRRRPPAPPNTPSTAAEEAALRQFWQEFQSAHQQKLNDYEDDGSIVSMTPNRSGGLKPESVRLWSGSHIRCGSDYRRSSTAASSEKRCVQMEDARLRRSNTEEEELIVDEASVEVVER